MFFKRMIDNPDIAKLLLRLSLGGLMLFHGVHKVMHGIGFIQQAVAGANLPQWLGYGIYVGEVLAPLLLLFGYFTRPAALLEVIVMVMAVILVHPGELLSLDTHGGYALELQFLYLFGSLALFFLGAGRYSMSGGRGLWD
ncbi:DoxX family protein [Prosthecochloris vibrioformis]|uniref:DoxX family protein n=1 Tax=Prosthecochloris vibrioformis TaxID=1098 RepID=A0A5C4RY87_PROVB|nr:DoxX family protein [Prosthecochloris vibrioformis]TNJ35992.1 DoxX family protein [Prosthecochloris vibrioformis]